MAQALRPRDRLADGPLATNRPGEQLGKPSPIATRRLVIEAARRAGVTLPNNAGRHTYISMHVAHFESIDKTALESDTARQLSRAIIWLS
jgi:hypothetical protein